MYLMFRSLLFILLILIPGINNAQGYSEQLSVQISAEVSSNPPVIRLNWKNDGSANSFEVYKRTAYSGNGWGNPLVTLGSGAAGYTDNTVEKGQLYEYLIIKNGSITGYGYLVSGIERILPTFRGILIMVVEDTYLPDENFSAAIEQTMTDITLDGWKVERINVNRNDDVVSVKQKIENIYQQNPEETRALYLIGHVPVPYSGLINPDGHSNHLGAWPADVYYGSFGGGWTDKQVNANSQDLPERIRNVPGDGKFDQSALPSDVKLETGRIDFSKLYVFDKSEKQLLIDYLERAHRYKTAQYRATRRGLVDDNFSGRSEGFASSGFRNFAAFFSAQNISTDVDFIQGTKMNGGADYLWGYGCGGGSYQSCSGVASSLDFATNDIKTVFTMLFGSYFGDWDSDNNLMKSTIAQGQTLTTAWAGRPHWHFYHMAMGDNIGYSTMITQNNNGDYYASSRSRYNRMIHIALLGDPSLRMEYLKPVENLSVTDLENGAFINWKAPDDNISGYNIYRKDPGKDKYSRINSGPVTGTAYIDQEIPEEGKYEYLLKSIKLHTSSSGSYYNESLAVEQSFDFIPDTIQQQEVIDYAIERSVQLYSEFQDNPPQFTLYWMNDGTAASYHIFRRIAGSGPGWNVEIGSPDGSADSFTDTDIQKGITYEYCIRKSGDIDGYGYMAAGTEIPAVEDKGILIMAMDNTYLDDPEYANAVNITISDIEKDGWMVKKIEVDRNEQVISVKQKIENIFKEDPEKTKALYLLGHVPVPYSGLINPDGHTDHRGAWPADVYYASFGDGWTDNIVNSRPSDAPERIWNVPGDGKFDQSQLPSDVQLSIGRVDFADLPLFNKTEKELLLAYMNKAHRYKTAEIIAEKRALIDDNFIGRNDGFASGGYRNFAPFFGTANIDTLSDFIEGTKINGGASYLFAMGCGGGSYDNCSGVASALDLSENELQIIFSMLFGSYFGDWDSENNLLRAAIAQGQTLTSSWSARPQLHYYHMALGSTIGECTRMSQNNDGDYYTGPRASYNRMIHVALMGDPSLRMNYAEPPGNISIENSDNKGYISWDSVDDEVLGYNIYRKDPGNHQFFKLNPVLVQATNFTDNSLVYSGDYDYMIKSLKLEQNPSGSYYNESLGAAKSFSFIPKIIDISDYSLERSVQLSASIHNNPDRIQLHWLNDGTATSYQIYKRLAGSGPGWGSEIKKTSGSATDFTDTDVAPGIRYEYRIIKNGNNTGYGYLVSGIEYVPESFKGKLIMVIENSFLGQADFDAAVNQTIEDIENDGWIVERIEVNREDKVKDVKQKIENRYNADPENTRALYLVGHIPVPYSGLINPDGHSNHLGAWPADVYYSVFEGNWTDKDINQSSGVPERIQNVPGDGKFDQSFLPADVVLQTGRVDFARQFLFNKSEKELLIQYLNTAHRYKSGEITASERALIDDNFSSRSEGFASGGFRNFSPFFGPENINTDVDFVEGTKMNGGQSYLWAYGCGPGSYQSCSGVVTTGDFASDDLQTVFTMLFGSYFGDWDSDNNLLRASLAQGNTLTTVWSGRPHWHFYHMAMGENIGFSARLTQNNDGDYYGSTRSGYNRMIHIALLGDPSLKMYYPKAPENLSITEQFSTAVLSWDAPSDQPEGYNIYRRKKGEKEYRPLNTVLLQETNFADNTVTESGEYEYMIKSVNLQLTSSGSYYNESLGSRASVSITVGMDDAENSSFSIYPNPSTGVYHLRWKALKGELDISLYSMEGKQLKLERTDASRGEFLLNAEDLPEGTYIIKISDGKDLHVIRQLVKL